jgi:hypothetical protein
MVICCKCRKREGSRQGHYQHKGTVAEKHLFTLPGVGSLFGFLVNFELSPYLYFFSSSASVDLELVFAIIYLSSFFEKLDSI